MSDLENNDPEKVIDNSSDETTTPEVEETPPTPEKLILTPNGNPPAPDDGPNPSELEEKLRLGAVEAEAAQ